jgi:hypothetical protein
MDADGYPIMPACLRRPQSGHDEEEEIELTMPPDAEEAA